MDAGTHAVRLRDLEQRINSLKEQVFRSKARLSLLAETVLQGVIGGSQGVIVHDSRMGASYKLVRASYALDGAPIMNRADERGGLSEQRSFDVYSGAMTPGDHTLTVDLEYRGDGYGVFSYLNGYRFRVRASHVFNAPEGGSVKIRVVAYEKGGPTAPIEERPALMFLNGAGTESAEPTAKAAPAAPKPAANVAPAAKASGTVTPTSASTSLKVEGAK